MVAQAAPPPWWMREKNDSSPIPRLRAISISGFVSAVKVTMPSTCDASIPASAIAASHASTARRISERPEAFENSVAPMPTIAPASRSRFAVAHGSRSRVTVPVTWSPRLLAPRRVTSTVASCFSVTVPVSTMVSPG